MSPSPAVALDPRRPGLPSSPGVRPSLYLCETEPAAAAEPDLFAGLTAAQRSAVLASGAARTLQPGDLVFRQGDRHEGIYVILTGTVRVFYTGPTGREITLAYWSPGNFVGGPELFGEGPHLWSGAAVRPTEVATLRGRDLRRLMQEIPAFSINLVDALVHKGRCYSTLIHMLGTRSVTERLAQLLLTMSGHDGARGGGGRILGRPLTHEELARMVGATRQWVSMTLGRFRGQGLIDVRRHRIVIVDDARLRAFTGCNELTDSGSVNAVGSRP